MSEASALVENAIASLTEMEKELDEAKAQVAEMKRKLITSATEEVERIKAEVVEKAEEEVRRMMDKAKAEADSEAESILNKAEGDLKTLRGKIDRSFDEATSTVAKAILGE